MKKIPRALNEVIESFERLPGIGPKSAARLGFYLLAVPDNFTEKLADSIANLKKKIKICETCFGVGEEKECEICRDDTRNRKLICVVERADEVLAVEAVGGFNGLYHVLGGAINPLDHVGPDDLKINELLNRVEGDGIEEIILATNPTIEGEGTALYIKKKLEGIDYKGKVSRIGSGLPMGAELGFADSVTLSRAFEGRREL
ncbi:MAG: recombination protein RecR [Candidatus Shapirobacteria bacterium GW2011_GWE1_38_10]|uniref:Recombination protein RecR n=1 Tax=Candidatus Shapirobacteria bacterium GW2011_GWE1_38_10 TaxID=1618488 RepID=A0A0G0KMQ2_9BACT|nr:MAG: recombination protein RecR [Candidatus Shapirobacteria bacterium GW2011_GWF2_37_20]KKQ50444.1 MAG: recombination protein RecR [Candidatus Shapirobacteria bacterium GW2011_GWE1_38_10]KKQ65100.1 MAG: recombination protein RecR [Candidatus Shapirobacteria bacterium GW2011_GWF1_38_23]HBP50857.1 recombination protein RecR [Candidatus Shapirobacteria bacterium]